MTYILEKLRKIYPVAAVVDALFGGVPVVDVFGVVATGGELDEADADIAIPIPVSLFIIDDESFVAFVAIVVVLSSSGVPAKISLLEFSITVLMISLFALYFSST